MSITSRYRVFLIKYSPARGVSSLVKHCININKLKLDRCEIPNEGLSTIGNLVYLKSLNLFRTKNINNQTIANIMHENQSLEEIDIRNCPMLTDDSLFSIAAHCPSLKSIYASHALFDFDSDTNFTSKGYMELFRKCKELVDINYCIYFDRRSALPIEIFEALKERKSLLLKN